MAKSLIPSREDIKKYGVSTQNADWLDWIDKNPPESVLVRKKSYVDTLPAENERPKYTEAQMKEIAKKNDALIPKPQEQPKIKKPNYLQGDSLIDTFYKWYESTPLVKNYFSGGMAKVGSQIEREKQDKDPNRKMGTIDTITNSTVQGAWEFDRNVKQGMRLLARAFPNKLKNFDDALKGSIEESERASQLIDKNMENQSWGNKFLGQGVRGATAMYPTLVLGDITGGAVANVINPATKTGKLIIKAAQMSPFFVNSVGSYSREAELDGADEKGQLIYGIVGGLIETVTEAPMFTKYIDMTNSFLSKRLLQSGAKNFTKVFGATAIDIFFNALGEGFQELITDPMTYAARKAIYNPDEKWTMENVKGMGESFLGGVSMSLILGGFGLPNTVAHNKAKAMAEKVLKGEKPTVGEAGDLENEIQTHTVNIEEQNKPIETPVTDKLTQEQQQVEQGPNEYDKKILEIANKKGIDKTVLDLASKGLTAEEISKKIQGTLKGITGDKVNLLVNTILTHGQAAGETGQNKAPDIKAPVGMENIKPQEPIQEQKPVENIIPSPETKAPEKAPSEVLDHNTDAGKMVENKTGEQIADTGNTINGKPKLNKELSKKYSLIPPKKVESNGIKNEKVPNSESTQPNENVKQEEQPKEEPMRFNTIEISKPLADLTKSDIQMLMDRFNKKLNDLRDDPSGTPFEKQQRADEINKDKETLKKLAKQLNQKEEAPAQPKQSFEEKINSFEIEDSEKKRIVSKYNELMAGAKKAGYNVNLSLNVVNDIIEDINSIKRSDRQIARHGFNEEQDLKVSGRAKVSKKADGAKLVEITIDLLNDSTSPITEDIIHEFAEVYLSLYKNTQKEDYWSMIKHFEGRGMAGSRASEFLPEVLTDYAIHKEIDSKNSGIKKYLEKFKSWIENIINRIAYFRKNVVPNLPENIKKQAENFANGNWEEAFSTINSVIEIDETNYRMKPEEINQEWLGNEKAIKSLKAWTDTNQAFKSDDTSINKNKLPRTFNIVKFEKGTVNADIGGGKFDNATEFLKEQGVKNYVIDPFNRTLEHNKSAVEAVKDGKADTATVNNVLNVIKEAEARAQVILNASNAIKKDGTAYFLIYEGNGSNEGKISIIKGKENWQNNRKTRTYIPEIERFFNDVTVKNGVIVAKDPIKDSTEYRFKDKSGYDPTFEDYKKYYPKEAKEEPKQEETIKEPGNNINKEVNHIQKSADMIKDEIKNFVKLSYQDITDICDSVFGGTQAEGKYTSKDATDIMELAVNQYILELSNESGRFIDNSAGVIIGDLNRLENILDRLPSQTKRTDEMMEFQQFSTPPTIAYLASLVADIQKNDTVLEPSAGIGGLAVFGKARGANVIVNELSKRRLEILKNMPFDGFYNENAEQIDNILPDSVKPTVVIMNPPFSATAGRMEGNRDTNFGLLHVEQALNRLEEGGRLVAIVGSGMAEGMPKFRDWWKKIKSEHNVRANVGISGKNYRKYGTSFDINVFVIDKTGPTPKNGTITGKTETLKDFLEKVRGLIYDREHRPTKQETNQPNVQTETGQNQSENGPKPTLPTPASESFPNETGNSSTWTQGNKAGDKGNSGKPNVSGTGNGNENVPADSTTGQNDTTGDSGISDRGNQVDTDRQGNDVIENKIAEFKSRASLPTTEELKLLLNDIKDMMLNKDITEDQRKRLNTIKNAVEKSIAYFESDNKRPDRYTSTEDIVNALDVEVKEKEKNTARKELTDSVYDEYKPQKLHMEGAKPHLGTLAQSSAMAVVEPPDPTYKPKLPKEIIESGKLSIAQLEAVVYAGQAHEQTLPSGERRGFFIGDGTGVGKGREIAGIILDNMNQGKDKAVWISKNDDLFTDAQRDWGDLGQEKDKLFQFSKVKPDKEIIQKSGILFGTYNLLGRNLVFADNGAVSVKQGQKARIDQLVNWLGKDFDGVIVFDEAHLMQNSTTQKGTRGKKKPSLRGLAGVELQKRLPNAKFVYVSATGATEVENLAYAERLGLWGRGTAFSDKQDFINKIKAGGLASMELVARDMKAMGAYLARNLSYDGVDYDKITHTLTPEQSEIYDEMARGWQIVLQNLNSALELTNQDMDGMAKGRAVGAFWSSQQRFFNQILTSMQMPSAITHMKEQLEKGDAVVIQLVNTNEATQNRQLEKLQAEEGSLEDLDLTPRDLLLQYLDKSFPTDQFEEYTDDNGNKRSRPVLDSNGKPVKNKQAERMKEELIGKIASLRVPEGPLEIIINTFGAKNVAEATGRTRRVIRETDELGNTKTRTENRTPKHVDSDVKDFEDDKKKILVFSEAGGTGKSYHASNSFKNKRHRTHYVVQAGWKADACVQGFGRTHRTNQASAPTYILVTTNLKGQMRFISSIARRLDQLGALTKGQRETGSQGLFSAKDNLESSIAKDSLANFYRNLIRGNFPGLNANDILTKMGLENKLMDKYGYVVEDQETLRDMGKFLNRILALESSEQNEVFDTFMNVFEGAIEIAQQNGTLDTGLENFKADTVDVIEEKDIRKDEQTGAETKYYQLKAGHKVKKVNFSTMLETAEKDRSFLGFYQNSKSGSIRACFSGGMQTLENGNIIRTVKAFGQITKQYQKIEEHKFTDSNTNWVKIENEVEAQKLWEEMLEKVPEYEYENVHLISGALLPVWDRLPSENVRVIKVATNNGDVLLGRLIKEREIDSILRRLGANRTKEQLSSREIADKILNQNYEAHLSNSWRLVRRKVAGEYRIELIGSGIYRFSSQLKEDGLFTETIQWETRYFVPTGENAEKVIDNLTKHRPITDLIAKDETAGDKDKFNRQKSLVPPQYKGDESKKDTNIGIIPKGFKPKKADISHNGFKFESKEVQEEYEKYFGMEKETFKSKLEALKEEFTKYTTRTIKYLEENVENAEAIKELVNFEKYRELSGDDAVRIMETEIRNLSRDEYMTFIAKVVLEDLKEEMELGHELPHPFTPDVVEKEIERIKGFITPEIEKALKERKRRWDEILEIRNEAMKAIGNDDAYKFKKENYYRHQVLAYAQQERLKSTGKTLNVPKNRGYTKKREGSEMPINYNYLEAEYSVLSQVIYDTKVAKMIKRLEKGYDVSGRLKAQAKKLNDGRIDEMIMMQKEQGMLNDKLRTPIEEALNTFKKKIGWSMSQLVEMADELDTGDSGEFESVVDGLRLKKFNINAFEDDSSRFFKYMSYLAGLDDTAPGVLQARTFIKAVAEKKRFIKDTLGDNFMTVDKIIPSGYTKWQPSKGNIFYIRHSIPQKIADRLISDTLKEFNVTKELLDEVLVIGGRKKEWVIKEDIAQSLDNILPVKETNKFEQGYSKFINGMKRWFLTVNPYRFVKYNVGNLFGDLDKVIAGATPALKRKYLQRAISELKDAYKTGKFTPDLIAWKDRGGFQSLMTPQEITSVNALAPFRRLTLEKESKFKKYQHFTENASNFRESILRYAAYLYYLEDLKENKGVPSRGYGASKMALVKGLKTNEDKAYKLSKDVLGAYDEISVAGKALRKHLIPFYSWFEVNFTGYVNMYKNILDNEELCERVGRNIAKGLSKEKQVNIGMAVEMGKLSLRAVAMTSILMAFNMLLHGDDEDKLPEEVRVMPHLILGKDMDGNILYFNRLGAMTDFLEWFGLQSFPQDMEDLFAGRRTLKEQLVEMAKSPVNKVASSINPIYKGVAEIATGSKLYPDVFNPSKIRDNGLHLAQQIGLQEEYKNIAGLPHRSYLKNLSNLVVSKADPMQSAYYQTLENKTKFEEKEGKPFIPQDKKSKALYNFKLALQYGDEKSAQKFYKLYFKYGGTDKGMKTSLKNMHPFFGLTDGEIREFRNSLNDRELKQLDLALKFYEEVLNNSKGMRK